MSLSKNTQFVYSLLNLYSGLQEKLFSIFITYSIDCSMAHLRIILFIIARRILLCKTQLLLNTEQYILKINLYFSKNVVPKIYLFSSALLSIFGLNH